MDFYGSEERDAHILSHFNSIHFLLVFFFRFIANKKNINYHQPKLLTQVWTTELLHSWLELF